MTIGTANNYHQTNTTNKVNSAHHWGEAINALSQAKSGYAPDRVKGATSLMQLISMLLA